MAIFKLTPDVIWNEQGKTNDNSLQRQLLLKPEKLTPVLTYLMGQEDERFPLSFLTEGMQNTMEIEGNEFEYNIIGRLYSPVMLAESFTSSTQPGIGFTPFKLVFSERRFARDYMIFTPNGYQIRVTEDPTQRGTNWEYTFVLNATNASEFVPVSELVAGNLFSQAFAPVASFGSTGNESFAAAPGIVRGQITTIRKSFAWEGNAVERTMTMQVQTDKGTTNYWWDFEEYQHMISFKLECEMLYWYAKDNRDDRGIITLKDKNGVAIPIGDGLLEQITNKDTYGILTTQKVKQVVRDALYGMSDASKKSITLFTGVGGVEEFDNAMKDDLASKSYIKLDAGKFVYGTGRNLELSGFFSTYQHIDGHTITIKRVNLFDDGPKALASPKHPISGLPLESYRMVFVDTSTYNGKPNLIMINKKGRAMIRRVVAGINELPSDFKGNDFRASDKDASSIHLLKASGIVLRRFNTSIDLQCNLS
jgi:hypothetical protein